MWSPRRQRAGGGVRFRIRLELGKIVLCPRNKPTLKALCVGSLNPRSIFLTILILCLGVVFVLLLPQTHLLVSGTVLGWMKMDVVNSVL